MEALVLPTVKLKPQRHVSGSGMSCQRKEKYKSQMESKAKTHGKIGSRTYAVYIILLVYIMHQVPIESLPII